MIREVVELESPNPYAKRIEFYQEDIVVGYLDYSLIYDRMEIDNFFVEEKNRRCGIGKKLMSYLKSFIPFIIIALIFAAASSIFSIIGPNKLSDLTDELSKGLVLDKNKIEVISKDISSSLNENKILHFYHLHHSNTTFFLYLPSFLTHYQAERKSNHYQQVFSYQ